MLFKMKQVFPTDANITKKLGKTLSNRVINRREEGIKYLKEAITLYKKDNNQEEVCKLTLYYFYHLLNHEEFDTLNEEIEYYKSDIVDWPGFHRFLGVFKQNLGRPEEDIINEFEKAIDKSRTDEEKLKSIEVLLSFLIKLDVKKYATKIVDLKNHNLRLTSAKR